MDAGHDVDAKIRGSGLEIVSDTIAMCALLNLLRQTCWPCTHALYICPVRTLALRLKPDCSMNRFSHAASTVDFRSRIEEFSFPCVGAKSAAAHDALQFVVAADLRSAADDSRIVRQLQDFAVQTARDAMFVSLAVLFEKTPRLDEKQFENKLWERLAAFHAIDVRRHEWDRAVSSDPSSPHFSMSIGGRAFYVVGLHPGASRRARRFSCAALVFNLHSQFEALRSDGRYEKLREAIGLRDLAYSGSRNPMLAAHGVTSEARQYSGRMVDASWQCPFATQSRAQRDGS
ncbi:MAG: guanitoxin biosynthesis heme-dependent pre-guanitoxin N-hydroxylase GntA [Dokdonella sp.]